MGTPLCGTFTPSPPGLRCIHFPGDLAFSEPPSLSHLLHLLTGRLQHLIGPNALGCRHQILLIFALADLLIDVLQERLHSCDLREGGVWQEEQLSSTPCTSHPTNSNHSLLTGWPVSATLSHTFNKRDPQEFLEGNSRTPSSNSQGTGPARPPTMSFKAWRACASGVLLSTACSSSGYLVMRWWGLMSKSPSICLPERLCFSHHCQGRWAGGQQSAPP